MNDIEHILREIGAVLILRRSVEIVEFKTGHKTEEEWFVWLKDFSAKTRSTFLVTRKRKGVFKVLARKYVCQHSSFKAVPGIRRKVTK